MAASFNPATDYKRRWVGMLPDDTPFILWLMEDGSMYVKSPGPGQFGNRLPAEDIPFLLGYPTDPDDVAARRNAVEWP